MKLIQIPTTEYNNYRLDVIFNGYKWDPQYSDNNTISEYALIITEQEHKELQQLTEKLDIETINAEKALNNNQKLANPLALPRKIRKELKRMSNYKADNHIRLMRYDFHPTAEGKWALSEVNSDVPGGLAEASIMPEIAAKLFDSENYMSINFGDIFANAITEKVKPNGKIMFVHCTSYSDDRQVMQFLSDKLESHGYHAIYAAADHLHFENNEAVSILDGNTGKIDAILRFTPLEWLIKIKPKRWSGYFDTTTISCNHPIAIYAQTKRFPFVWDTLQSLGVELSTWRELLPETLEVKAAKGIEGFIFKPVYGRVGEDISIKEACKDDEYRKILKEVKKKPHKYIAQKKFNSRPIATEEGASFHVCLGSYCVDGKAAGYYARISDRPRIDSYAADIPVLVELVETPLAAPENRKGVACCDREAFEIWAPKDIKWSAWVKPAPFVMYNNENKNTNHAISFDIPPIMYLNDIQTPQTDTAIILDLPDYTAINESLALAELGWRPIPLYNGTDEQPGAMPLVDNHGIELALSWGAATLKGQKIKEDAPPVFLLDSNRLHRYKMNASVFDNSWDIYDQDLPSPEFFIKNGITNIIVRGEKKIQKDLRKILFEHQKKGLLIHFTDGYEPPKEIRIKKPRLSSLTGTT